MTLPAVLHVAEEMAALAGGVPAVVRQLSRRLASAGHDVSVAHVRGDASDLADAAMVTKYEPAGLRRVWGHSPALLLGMQAASAVMADRGGVVHIHGVWAAPQMLAAKCCAASAAPFVFTAHGMLEPWLWNQQGWAVKVKKRLFWQLVAQPRLRHSTAVHAITPLERDHLSRLLPGCNAVVIPNAIDLVDDPVASSRAREPVVLFLGRIEPKKGVDILIRAFAQARLSADWRLELVGPSWSDDYLQALQGLVDESGLSSRVHFRGPLFGADKQKLLDTAWVMAAPSHSEVVGLVNLEAGAHCLPSITTHQTGLGDWMAGGGLLIEPEVDALRKALVTASSWSAAEQRERGVASRQLVERRYSWAAVTPLWQALYSDLVNKKVGVV